MRVIVLGAGGMLGSDLCPLLAERFETIGLSRTEADVTDAAALRAKLSELAPDVVVNCAAATNVDRCETEPDWAYQGNAWGAWNAASAAEAAGARLIHISTDFVFSGESEVPYTEWDPTGPLSAYGASKLAGEVAVWRACRSVSIVRTQWLYGRNGASFPRAILNAARKNPADGLRVVADQFGSPTYTRHLARKLVWLVETSVEGLYHVSNAGECSRHEWAVRLLQLAGISEVAVMPIPAAEWTAPAPRPRRSTLRRYALELMGADDMPPWEAGLEEYVAELRESHEL